MSNNRFFIVAIVVAAIVLFYITNMAYFSIKPDSFPVKKSEGAPKGVLFSDTINKLIGHELDGLGGWTPNDIPPSPTWLLDNKPSFQMGVLEVVRYTSLVLRDNLSRQRTTDEIDNGCDQAFTRFSNDPYKWIIPSAEGKYREGIEALSDYVHRLKFGTTNFYPRSDNLIQLLEKYVSLLGGVNTRLLNASKESEGTGEALSGTGDQEQAEEKHIKVPWAKIDDNFYYAQGVGYGLYHMLQAVQSEFDTVLRDKNSHVLLKEIVASLEETYFEPLVITNGSKAGIFANHSSNLRVFLDDARQKINSIMIMLNQG